MLTGCVPGLAADPRFATNSGARPQGAATTKPPPPGPAADRRTQERLGLAATARSGCSPTRASPPRPASGWIAQPTTPTSTRSTAGSGTLSIGAVRARSSQTPHDAGPLVFTTGADLPSSTQLAVWLSRAGADVLRTHPIVAIDRRGIGHVESHRLPRPLRPPGDARSGAIQARRRPRRQPFRDLEYRNHKLHRRHRAGRLVLRQPLAASDIERLRNLWDVPALALIGIGNGAQVALAYAGSRPDKVARLILDSPIALGVNAEAAAEQQVEGPASRTRRVRRAVRCAELRTGSRSQGRRHRAAGRRPAPGRGPGRKPRWRN